MLIVPSVKRTSMSCPRIFRNFESISCFKFISYQADILICIIYCYKLFFYLYFRILEELSDYKESRRLIVH